MRCHWKLQRLTFASAVGVVIFLASAVVSFQVEILESIEEAG